MVICAARTGTSDRSATATTQGGSPAESSSASRPASHSAQTVAMKRCGAPLAPVQFGTAVRKNPASAAAP